MLAYDHSVYSAGIEQINVGRAKYSEDTEYVNIL